MKQLMLGICFIFGILGLCCIIGQILATEEKKRLWKTLRLVCIFFTIVFLTVFILAKKTIG